MAGGRCAALCLAVHTALAGFPSAAQAQTPDDRPAAARPPGAEPLRHWRQGDLPPEVEGIRLGDTLETVVSVLGAPAPVPPGLADPSADLQTLRYRGGALMIGVSKTTGVAKILLRKREGGELAGVRVGDRLGALVRLWGAPTAGGGSVGKWPLGDWTVSARGDMGANVVLSMMLARTAPQPALAPPVAPAQ